MHAALGAFTCSRLTSLFLSEQHRHEAGQGQHQLVATQGSEGDTGRGGGFRELRGLDRCL